MTPPSNYISNHLLEDLKNLERNRDKYSKQTTQVKSVRVLLISYLIYQKQVDENQKILK